MGRKRNNFTVVGDYTNVATDWINFTVAGDYKNVATDWINFTVAGDYKNEATDWINFTVRKNVKLKRKTKWPSSRRSCGITGTTLWPRSFFSFDVGYYFFLQLINISNYYWKHVRI